MSTRQVNSHRDFWSRVQGDDWTACWLWKGRLNGYGYGDVLKDGRRIGAHQHAYAEMVGEVPNGLQLDHLCRNRACVNPYHLQPVTIRENLHRSPLTQASINAAKTHCVNGHEFTPENTRIHKARGYRVCKACAREWMRAKRASHRRAA